MSSNRVLLTAAILAVVTSTGHAQCTRCPGNANSSLIVLHDFTGSPDGGIPTGSLLDVGGNLYGTTSQGGSGSCPSSGCGTIFKVDSTGNESLLYSFAPFPDGATPQGVIQDALGNLYGITNQGGTSNNGAVFKLDPTGKETVLYNFNGPPDGAAPMGTLLLDGAGNLYGTTHIGGTANRGTIFKLDPGGKETLLYSFTGKPDGASPRAGLIQDMAGNFYGTTSEGGTSDCGNPPGSGPGCGTVFKLDTTGKETVLYNFQGSVVGPDGAFPATGLTLDAAGNLYGTTLEGGQASCRARDFVTVGCGTIFKLDTTGKESVLHRFTYFDGYAPQAGLVQDSLANLFGTANSTIFEIGAGGNFTLLYAFTFGADGNEATGGLVRDASGNLYGTAKIGGKKGCTIGCGTLWELPATADTTVNVSVELLNNGAGTVTSNPPGINCGATCWAGFPSGTSVTLTANPASGSLFSGWGGTCSSPTNTICVVNATGLQTAAFLLAPPPDFALGASPPTPATVNPGGSSTMSISIVGLGSFNSSVTLSCSVQPAPSLAPTCSVNPQSGTPGTAAALTINTTPATSAFVPSKLRSRLAYSVCLPFLGLALLSSRAGREKKSRILVAAVSVVLLAGFAFQIACGGSSSSVTVGSVGTPAGSYTITVNGASGALQHSVTTTLTVQ